MPEGVAAVAAEEGLLEHVTLTAEPGVIGGMPQGGLDFGAALNPDAILQQSLQFDFYDGGGLDMACLGMAETDRLGNVNVSKFGPRFAGAGGFINISQNASRLVLAGTFTAGGLEVAVEDGALRIVTEGRTRKFVEAVEQITFSGELAAETGKPVLYVTERCVFTASPKGLQLIEIAPGIDLGRDILAHMAFTPIIDGPVPMDPRLFRPEPMGLRAQFLEAPIDTRITFDADRDLLLVNLRGYAVRTRADLDAIAGSGRGARRPTRPQGRHDSLVRRLHPRSLARPCVHGHGGAAWRSATTAPRCATPAIPSPACASAPNSPSATSPCACGATPS